MTPSELDPVEQVWPTIAPLLFVPHTEHEYDELVQMLDTLSMSSARMRLIRWHRSWRSLAS